MCFDEYLSPDGLKTKVIFVSCQPYDVYILIV